VVVICCATCQDLRRLVDTQQSPTLPLYPLSRTTTPPSFVFSHADQLLLFPCFFFFQTWIRTTPLVSENTGTVYAFAFPQNRPKELLGFVLFPVCNPASVGVFLQPNTPVNHDNRDTDLQPSYISFRQVPNVFSASTPPSGSRAYASIHSVPFSRESWQ